MLIDNNYYLVMVATDPARPTYAEFYRIDAVLNLQHAAGSLPDHPGLALIEAESYNGELAWYLDDLRPEQVRQINRWTAAGWLIAFRWNAGGSARIDRRRARKHLTDEQIFWLRQYAEMSMLYGAAKANAENIAISGDSAGGDKAEAAQAKRKRKATKKARKSTAKQRRQQRIEEQWNCTR